LAVREAKTATAEHLVEDPVLLVGVLDRDDELELSNDVTAFTNADGGVVLIDLETKHHPASMRESARKLRAGIFDGIGAADAVEETAYHLGAVAAFV
jgi:hypothetical protein